MTQPPKAPASQETDSPNTPPTPPAADRPIDDPKDDRLGRLGLARLLAAQALAPKPADGFVLGLTGSWGSGKTSLLNLVEAELRDRAFIVTFNPWLFGRGDELVIRFLSEFAASLPKGRANKQLRAEVEAYAEILVPLGGIPGALAALVRKVIKGGSPEARRDRIARELALLDRRVVVFLDDIDRLSPMEVADIMRLVKVVADFPNTTFLLAYDPAHVAHALDQTHGGAGRDYLEKIVQASHPLPHVEASVLAQLLTDALRDAQPTLSLRSEGQTSPEWAGRLIQVISPLLRTVRDVRRITNVSVAALELTGDEVAAVDVVTLETLRLLAPDFHARLPQSARALTRTRAFEMLETQGDRDKEIVEALITESGIAESVARAAINELFPSAEVHLTNTTYGAEFFSEWRRERRVAIYENLMTYLTKAVGEHVIRTALVRDAVSALSHRSDFGRIVDDLAPRQRTDLLLRVADFIGDVPTETSQQAIVALLEQIPKLRQDEKTFFDVDPEFAVRPLVGYLLERAAPLDRPRLAEAAFADTVGLYPKFRFLMWFGTFEGEDAREGLIDSSTTAGLREDLTDQILGAPAQELVDERQFRRFIPAHFYGAGARGRSRLRELAQDDVFLLAMLTAAATRVEADDVHAERPSMERIELSWDQLLGGFGADVLIARVKELAATAWPRVLSEYEREVLDAATHLADSE